MKNEPACHVRSGGLFYAEPDGAGKEYAMSKIRVKQLVVGMVETNCYIIYNEETKAAVIVDPGDNPKEISKKMRRVRCKTGGSSADTRSL